jgi:hypothetical protein
MHLKWNIKQEHKECNSPASTHVHDDDSSDTVSDRLPQRCAVYLHEVDLDKAHEINGKLVRVCQAHITSASASASALPPLCRLRLTESGT